MRDELDELVESLRKETEILPDENIKKQSISGAIAAFDAQNARARQGSALLHRLMNTAQAVYQTMTGEQMMKKTYMIAGGASFAVLGLLMVGSQGWQTDVVNIAHQGEVLEKPVSVTNSTASVAPATRFASEVVASPPPAFAVATPQADSATLGVSASPPPAAPLPQSLDAKRMAYPSGAVNAQSADMLVTPYVQPQNQDKFTKFESNDVQSVLEQPVSTFSIDVDTASYAVMRASLNQNRIPPKDAIRIEELINYFPYDYDAPESKAQPFKSTVSVFPTPWNKNTKLMHIGIKGYEIEQKERPSANLVFLVDTSGSMYEPNKLPLLQNAMKLLLDNLQPQDHVSIVTYAGSAGVALHPTQVKEKAKILAVLDGLQAAGSTAGAEGIRQAYQLAEANFDREGINRIMLATDGDFNVGITDPQELKHFVEQKRESGIYLSVLGFGMGNYKDETMQILAQNGNGNAAYIDNLNEARKVLVDEASSMLFPIAKDVKIQIEFNPNQISEYRLIGYETRMLNREDFNNDKVDAGEIGAGHSVTAIYEITPVGSESTQIDPLRYQQDKKKQAPAKTDSDEYAFIKIRYKQPAATKSQLIETAITKANEVNSLDNVSTEARFATAVAAFAQLLRGDDYTQSYSYDDVIALADTARGNDPFGYRVEFLNLVRLAKSAPAISPLPVQ